MIPKIKSKIKVTSTSQGWSVNGHFCLRLSADTVEKEKALQVLADRGKKCLEKDYIKITCRHFTEI